MAAAPVQTPVREIMLNRMNVTQSELNFANRMLKGDEVEREAAIAEQAAMYGVGVGDLQTPFPGEGHVLVDIGPLNDAFDLQEEEEVVVEDVEEEEEEEEEEGEVMDDDDDRVTVKDEEEDSELDGKDEDHGTTRVEETEVWVKPWGLEEEDSPRELDRQAMPPPPPRRSFAERLARYQDGQREGPITFVHSKAAGGGEDHIPVPNLERVRSAAPPEPAPSVYARSEAGESVASYNAAAEERRRKTIEQAQHDQEAIDQGKMNARDFMRRTDWNEVDGRSENKDLRIRKLKQELMRALQRRYGGPKALKALGISMNMSLIEMRYEVARKDEQDKEDKAVDWYMKILRILMVSIQEGNERFGKYLYLNHFASYMDDELELAREPLRLIHRRMASKRESNPYYELLWLIIGSLIFYHFTIKLTGEPPKSTLQRKREAALQRRREFEQDYEEDEYESEDEDRDERSHGASREGKYPEPKGYYDGGEEDEEGDDIRPPTPRHQRPGRRKRMGRRTSPAFNNPQSSAGEGGLNLSNILGMFSSMVGQ